MTVFPTRDFVRLDGREVSLIVDCRGPAPVVVHWGDRLHDDVDPALLAFLATREEAPCSPAVEAPIALTPLHGQAFPGRPGLLAHRDGLGWATYTRIERVEVAPGSAEIVSIDPANEIELIHRLALDPDQDVLKASTEVINRGAQLLTVDACAATTLPIPSSVTHLTGFEGRWAGEFQTRTFARSVGEFVRENRRGRTSHDAYPALLAEIAPVSATAGAIYGFHLGWSGNHRLVAQTLSDGRAFVQMGELFMPGEVRLGRGESYRSPDIFSAFSTGGRSGLSRAFHRYMRARPEHARLRVKPRPIHYNTWEAVYFNHDPEALMKLADAAADVGAERFVLDDGWFRGRRNDKAGLGDWFVDEGVYPDGLGPLINHVRGLGLEFGIWVEPEMVNPDSDLFRAHPDWVLGTPPAPQLIFRNQLVLDFGRAEVRDYLFERLDALLSKHPIAYLKWDMNRDISHPGGADGAAGAHAHVLGLYEVLARIRATHPDVEIESCSAGGGRADFGILHHTDRVWTSDSNDALDRLKIQKGVSLFIPPELMGSHVGPTDCHITGRRINMSTRVASALFGHFGIEADLLALTPEELAELSAGVALHKRHRALIHSGDLFQLDRPDSEVGFGIVAPDKGEGIFSITALSEPSTYFPDRLHLAGLDTASLYKVRLVWPTAFKTLSPVVASLVDGLLVPGDVLIRFGLELPRMKPQAALILHVLRQD